MGVDKKIFLKKKILVGAVSIILLAGIGISYGIKNSRVKAKEVNIENAVKETIIENTIATGNIEANYRSNILLDNKKKIIKVQVTEGQAVKKDDVLVVFDSSDEENELEKQQINLKNAELTLNQMLNGGVEADKSASENSAAQANYSLENAKRKYDDANKKLKQNEELFNSGAISKNEYEDSKKNMEDSYTAVKSAEDALENAKTSLKATNSNSEAKIANQKNQIELIKKDIENYKQKIKDCTVTSNIDGKVIKVDAKENQYPSSGDQIIVDDVSKYKVVVNLKQYDALKAKIGQKANVKIKGSENSYSGTVIEIGQFAAAETNSSSDNQDSKVKVTVTIDDPGEEIKSGYEADVEFIFNEKKDSLAVRFDGIKEDKEKGQKFIFAVDPNNKVTKKYINIGIESEYYAEVTDGIDENEEYVLNPPENLKEGDLVIQGSSAKTSSNPK